MAKINHTNYLDVVDTIFSSSKMKGLTHINSDEDFFDGTSFTIRGKELKNFGTCGYLGLETHPLLAEGSIDLVKKYGTQFSIILDAETLFLGFSADYEKQKYGAKQIKTFAYIKVSDTYNMELLNAYANN